MITVVYIYTVDVNFTLQYQCISNMYQHGVIQPCQLLNRLSKLGLRPLEDSIKIIRQKRATITLDVVNGSSLIVQGNDPGDSLYYAQVLRVSKMTHNGSLVTQIRSRPRVSRSPGKKLNEWVTPVRVTKDRKCTNYFLWNTVFLCN